MILCIFGRGIERVRLNASGRVMWRPTRYIEQLAEKGGHPGWRMPCEMNSDDPRVVIAGANANVHAAIRIFRRSASRRESPKIVVFAAGRPTYLQEEPLGLSEGSVLRDIFVRKVGDLMGDTEIVMQQNNRTTRDDLIQTLRLAQSRGIERVNIISVRVHLDRCGEFMHHAVIADPTLRTIRVRFIASEEILKRRSRLHDDLFSYGMNSLAHERTEAQEHRGIRDLRAGKYAFGPVPTAPAIA